MDSTFIPPLTSPVPVDPTNELKITDLDEVLQLLRRHGYSGTSYYHFGLYLGLSTNTISLIEADHKGDTGRCFSECLTKWLQKADDVQKKGGPTIYSLVSALRELGENGVADGIDVEKHPACKSLARYASNQSLLSALPQLVIVLYLAKLIKGMILPSNVEGEALLCEVKESVCIDYQKLGAFADILRKSTTTAEIGRAILKEYREVFCNDDLIGDNVEGLKIYLPKSFTSDLNTMRLKFGQTFFKVGSIMMRNSQAPYIDNMKCVLRIYNKALRPQLDQCKNIREILELVSDISSLDDISKLEHFVNEFNIEEAKPVIEEYKEAVKELKETKLSHCLEEKISNASRLECERITIVVDKDADQFTLEDVRRLASAIFDSSLSQHVRLNVVREGNSFTITCSFPLILSEQLISVARSHIHISRENNVKRLTIGYCSVYEIDEIDGTIILTATMESGFITQQMISLSVQMINSNEMSDEDSMTLMTQAESLMELLDTKVMKMLSYSVAESDEFKEYDEKKIKEIFEEQLASMALKYEVQNLFEDIAERLPLIAEAFNKSVSEAEGLVDEANEGLEIIREHEKVRRVPQVKKSYRSLSKTTDAVHSYLDKVNELYRLLSEQTPDVIEDIEKGRLKSSDQLAVKINEILKGSTRDYETLDACFKEFATNSNSAQSELRRLKEEAESRRRTAAYTAGAAAAGGVVGSILLGVFTAGIGAAVGIAATLGTTGTATAIAIALVIAFGNTAATFGKMNERLEKLEIKLIHGMIKEIHLTINEKVKRMTDAERRDLAMKMRSTQEKSKKLHSETSSGLKVAEKIKTDITGKVDDVFSH